VSYNYDMGEAWPPEQAERAPGGIVYGWTIQPRHKK